MARTGISIQVSNAVFGSVPNVDANSMLVVAGAAAVATGTIAFDLDTPYLLRSAADLDVLDITAANNPEIFKEVNDFYAPKSGVNNTGTILWLVGVATFTDATTLLAFVRATVEDGFQNRPRNLIISQIELVASRQVDPSAIQTQIDQLYTEGFSTVAILGDCLRDTINPFDNLEDLALQAASMVGLVVVTDVLTKRACVGKVGGFMASLSVGTSIGDASLSFFAADMWFTNKAGVVETYVNTPCATITLAEANDLGDKQYIFARTRPPYNGLWLNDGATCQGVNTALSTLEAARTIASLVDSLRAFLTPYINNKVPVKSDGDIEPTYKQVVLDNGRAKVIVPYIESGDISDASLTIDAKNNDMVTTRTWEVTLSVLPAPTLRWVDGYVFYVSSL